MITFSQTFFASLYFSPSLHEGRCGMPGVSGVFCSGGLDGGTTGGTGAPCLMSNLFLS